MRRGLGLLLLLLVIVLVILALIFLARHRTPGVPPSHAPAYGRLLSA